MTRKGTVPFHPLACFRRWEETHTKGICQTSSRQSPKLRFEPGTLSWGPAAITFSSVCYVLKGKAIDTQTKIKMTPWRKPIAANTVQVDDILPSGSVCSTFPINRVWNRIPHCRGPFSGLLCQSWSADSLRLLRYNGFVFSQVSLGSNESVPTYTFCCSGCLFWLADGFVDMAITRKLTEQVRRSSAHLSMSSHSTGGGDGWGGDIGCWVVRGSRGGIECEVLLEPWTKNNNKKTPTML